MKKDAKAGGCRAASLGNALGQRLMKSARESTDSDDGKLIPERVRRDRNSAKKILLNRWVVKKRESGIEKRETLAFHPRKSKEGKERIGSIPEKMLIKSVHSSRASGAITLNIPTHPEVYQRREKKKSIHLHGGREVVLSLKRTGRDRGGGIILALGSQV